MEKNTATAIPRRRAASARKGPAAQGAPLGALLRAELARRCGKNPAYSLRAFARSLELSPAFVSKLLHGQRRFTDATIARLEERLGLSPAELARFREAQWESAEPGLPSFRPVSLDDFQLIADWYHFAILELTTLAGFDPSPLWVARKLGISRHQAADALTRLERLGYLVRDKRGKLRLGEEHNTSIGAAKSLPGVARAQQIAFLELAINAVRDLPCECCPQSGMTMAIPSSRMPEAVAVITRFRQKLMALLQRPGERDSVYHLSISLFPLTKLQE